MSIMGIATGTPATIDSFVNRIPSRSHSATSVDVPPMSKVMMFGDPAASATRKAPTTPPAGPDKILRTGSFAADWGERLPPEDCITRNLGTQAPRLPGTPEACVSNRFRYLPINGCKYAFTQTVEVRSYSRYSGRI